MIERGLESYLADQSDDGIAREAGEFSINVQRAREHLSNFNLIRESAWVLLLVQAAVQWKCESLDLTQTRYLTRFAFLFSDRPPAREDIQKQFSRLSSEFAHPLEKFVLVMQILKEKLQLEFRVTIKSADGTTEIMEFGELHFFDRFRKHLPSTLVLDVNHHRAPHAQEVFPILVARREQLGIRDELKAHCAPCPVPISLDSVPFQGPLFPSFSQQAGERIPWAIQTMGHARSALPVMAMPYGLESGEGVVSSGQEISGIYSLLFELPTKKETLPPEMRERSHIFWVKNGVVIQAHKLKLGSRILSVSLFVNCEGLETDLTGFQLVDNKALKLRKEQAFIEFKSALAKSLKSSLSEGDLDKVKPRDHKVPHPILGTGLFLTVFAPLMAVGALITIFGGVLLFNGNLVVFGAGSTILGSGIWGYKNQPLQVTDLHMLEQCKEWLAQDLKMLSPFL